MRLILMSARLSLLKSILLHLESLSGEETSPHAAADAPIHGPSVAITEQTTA